MHETQPHGVQRLAREVAARRQRCRLRQIPPLPPGVERVADQRVPLVGHVDPDLVGSSGDQPAVDQAGSVPGLLDGVKGAGGPAVPDHRHPLPVLGVTIDGRVDDALATGKHAVAHREIGLGDLSASKGQRQGLVGAVGLGHHHETGGVLVEAVDDPRARHTADPRQVVAVVKQGVDERAAGVPGRRVDDQTGRFVDHQQLGVLVDDLEGQVLGGDVQNLGVGLVDDQHIGLGHQRCRFCRAVVVAYAIVVDEPPDPRTGPVLRQLGETAIEPAPGELGGDGESVDPAHARPRRPIHQWMPIPIPTRPTEIS